MAPDHRAVFAPLVLPKSVLRRNRLARRDEAIRAVRRRHFTDHRITYAAQRLASALGAYATSGGRTEKHVDALPESASGRHRALHGILRANNGASLGWRRIVDIFNALQ
jgi:hypothetical protein